MTRQELVKLVVEISGSIREYGAVRYATGKNPTEENYEKSMTMFSEISNELTMLCEGVLNYLPFEVTTIEELLRGGVNE